MGAFIIMNNARRRSEEEDERRKKHEKKMIASGFVKKKIISNPATRYHHVYVNLETKKTGKLLLLLSLVGVAMIGLAFFLFGATINYFFPVATTLLLFIVGYSKFKNTKIEYSASVKPEIKEGLNWVSMNDETDYIYDWVKKDK